MYLKSFFVLFGVFFVCFANEKDESVLQDEGLKESKKYYSDSWRKMYNNKMLENQPKWRLSDDQPADSTYEVREYDSAYWVSSTKPCWNQDQANTMGYVNLYFYLMGFNHQSAYYDLTYPIITRIEKVDIEEENLIDAEKSASKSGKGNKDRRSKQCPRKHTAMVYIPAENDKEVGTPSTSVIVDKLPQRVVYVREFYGNDTSELCNQQATELAGDLIEDEIEFDQDDWYCARYIPGVDQVESRYETWFVGTQ